MDRAVIPTPRADAVFAAAHAIAEDVPKEQYLLGWSAFVRGISLGLAVAQLEPGWARDLLTELASVPGIPMIGAPVADTPEAQWEALFQQAGRLVTRSRELGASEANQCKLSG